MKSAEFFSEAFDGLEEYYPCLKNLANREKIAEKLAGSFKLTGNSQKDYENLRDMVEKEISNR